MHYFAVALKRCLDDKAKARRQPSRHIDFDPCSASREIPYDAANGGPAPHGYHGMEERQAAPELAPVSDMRKTFGKCIHVDPPETKERDSIGAYNYARVTGTEPIL